MKKACLFLSVLVMLCAGCKPDVESCFTYAANDLSVAFASTCSIEAVSFDWEFGDGGTSIAANPTHTYAQPGTYLVTLRVTDKKGRTNTVTETVVIVDPVPANQKFNGTYSLTETCDTTGTDAYTVTLTPSTSNANTATITGLYRETGASVVATIGSDGTGFTIAPMDIGPGTIQSAGTCVSNSDGSTINLVYRFTNETTGASEVCHAVLTR